MGRHNKEGLDVVCLQEAVPLMAMARLHLVVSVQAGEGGLCDVNLPMGKACKHVRVSGPATQGPWVQGPRTSAHLHIWERRGRPAGK